MANQVRAVCQVLELSVAGGISMALLTAEVEAVSGAARSSCPVDGMPASTSGFAETVFAVVFLIAAGTLVFSAVFLTLPAGSFLAEEAFASTVVTVNSCALAS